MRIRETRTRNHGAAARWFAFPAQHLTIRMNHLGTDDNLPLQATTALYARGRVCLSRSSTSASHTLIREHTCTNPIHRVVPEVPSVAVTIGPACLATPLHCGTQNSAIGTIDVSRTRARALGVVRAVGVIVKCHRTTEPAQYQVLSVT